MILSSGMQIRRLLLQEFDVSFLLINDDTTVSLVESIDASDIKNADCEDIIIIDIDNMKVYGIDGDWHHISRFRVLG